MSRVGGREGEGYISPALQREAIASYATELGGEISEWFSDEDFSGGNTRRPGFQAALAKSRAGEADGIVVMRIDRFARSVSDGASIVRELVDAGQVFASCHERIDPRTPEGKYMLTSFFANAELFLDQSKASWKAAKARAIKRGAPMGPTPFGYLRVKSPATKPSHISPVDAAALVGGEPAVGSIVPDPNTGPLVAEIFRRAAAGDTLGEITEWLNLRHRPEGRRPFSGSEIRRWLSNRFYLGEIRYGELSAVDSHPALTEPRTFDAAQPGPARAKRKGQAMTLAGLLRCENCRETMTGNRFGGSKHDLPVYRCGSRCGSGAVISASLVEDHVFGQVREAIRGFRLAGSKSDMRAIDAAVTSAEEELDAFVSNLSIRAALDVSKWEDGVKVRSDALNAARAERDAAVKADRLLAIDLDEPSEHDLRSFAFATIDAVYVGRGRGLDRVRLAWAGDDDDP